MTYKPEYVTPHQPRIRMSAPTNRAERRAAKKLARRAAKKGTK